MAGPRNNMAPEFKRKSEGLWDRLHGRFSANKHVCGKVRGATTHSHHKALEKHSMGGKNPVLAAFDIRWSAFVGQAKARWQQ